MPVLRPQVSRTRLRRQLFALLLLVLTLVVQSTAVASENREHHGMEHCCVLCHVFQPSLEATAPPAISPLVCMQWLAPDRHFEFLRNAFRPTCSSRGPPSLF